MQEENKVKRSFRKNMKAELKKVIWPTGKQVVKSTFATIGFVLLISIILVVLNYAFSFLNTKWFDLVLPNNENNSAVVSGDVSSGEITSGESDVIVDSGEVNNVTE